MPLTQTQRLTKKGANSAFTETDLLFVVRGREVVEYLYGGMSGGRHFSGVNITTMIDTVRGKKRTLKERDRMETEKNGREKSKAKYREY